MGLPGLVKAVSEEKPGFCEKPGFFAKIIIKDALLLLVGARVGK